MLALLGILVAALLVGKLAGRITPAIQLALVGLIALIVLADFASWGPRGAPGVDFLRELMSAFR